MQNYKTTLCKRGHERLVGASCIECSRERSRLYAAEHKEQRAAYQLEYKAKKNAEPRFCKKGLHERKPGQRGACGPCLTANNAAKRTGFCKNGHEHIGPGKCKECQREYLRKWHEEHPDYARQYYAENPEKVKAWNSTWRKKWRTENRDEYNARCRAEYAKNPEPHKAGVMRWRRRFPDRWHALANRGEEKRRALKLGILGSHTAPEWQAIVAKQRGRCASCGEKCVLTKDHIVPLSRGGCDYAFNIQGLCKPCNSRKRASMAAGLQHSLFDRLHVVEIIRRE